MIVKKRPVWLSRATALAAGKLWVRGYEDR
jgi:hypothetical protein